MTAALIFFAPGTPQPQGSKTVYRGRAVDANAVRLKPWRRAVTAEAMTTWEGAYPMCGPLRVSLVFTFVRPKAIRRGVVWKVARPDIDKACRAVLDALTDAKVWDDDAQVCVLLAEKRFGEVAGVAVHVSTILEEP